MTKKVLQHFGITEDLPNVEYLQKLITAYCNSVPWESVSKILKKRNCNNGDDCVRLENEFWSDQLNYGTGGTCYESNWAFYKMLQSLGFECYLTINKISDKSSVHSAIIVTINNSKYIADIGYPLYAAIPVIKNGVVNLNHQLINYRSTAIGSNEYLIENFPHPKPYLYHLTDIPVSDDDYLKVAASDYCDTGLFFDRIVIRKVIDSIPRRFDSEDLPYNIHALQNGTKTKTFVEAEILIETLSDYFSLDIDLIRKGFEILNKRNSVYGLQSSPH